LISRLFKPSRLPELHSRASSSTAKQIAQQTAQRAAFLVDQAIQEKQSIIVRAQGEAQSAQLIGDAVKANKGFLQLRKLEAAVSRSFAFSLGLCPLVLC
jgi:regulator of protease activity HflC (stomatin/prohibitin superfamily)